MKCKNTIFFIKCASEYYEDVCAKLKELFRVMTEVP